MTVGKSIDTPSLPSILLESNNSMEYIKGRPIVCDLMDAGSHTLLSLSNIIDLLKVLTPDERVHFQHELQCIIDNWVRYKSIDGGKQSVNTFEKSGEAQ